MCYCHTGDRRYLDKAEAIADWFMNLPGMPSDLVPYWDMKAPGTESADNPEVARDASAASVIASGLYELAEYVEPEKGQRYSRFADTIIQNLTTGYILRPEEADGFILGHSTGHHPAGSEIDVPLVYADYYYLEALLRKRKKDDKHVKIRMAPLKRCHSYFVFIGYGRRQGMYRIVVSDSLLYWGMNARALTS